ncbi:MAG: pyrroline-5-carboxylate reductase [Candidatus Binatia bacterium]
MAKKADPTKPAGKPAGKSASRSAPRSAGKSAGSSGGKPGAKVGGKPARSSARKITVGFIGGGNMAEAMLKGLLASGLAAESLLVSEPDAARRRAIARRYKVAVTADNAELLASSSTVVLAVKPQVLGAVLEALAPSVTGRELFVSIAAGVMLPRLEKLLGAKARVVRVMPNTPSLVGKGASVICPGRRATAADVKLVTRLFAAVGIAHVIRDEKLMHVVTALSGSGPAYVYRFAEALTEAAVKGGLEAGLARALTYQTIAGAAAMMIETGQEPADLRRAVSSPGGTTLAGLAILDEKKFVETVKGAVAAAARRSVELGKG